MLYWSVSSKWLTPECDLIAWESFWGLAEDLREVVPEGEGEAELRQRLEKNPGQLQGGPWSGAQLDNAAYNYWQLYGEMQEGDRVCACANGEVLALATVIGGYFFEKGPSGPATCPHCRRLTPDLEGPKRFGPLFSQQLRKKLRGRRPPGTSRTGSPVLIVELTLPEWEQVRALFS